MIEMFTNLSIASPIMRGILVVAEILLTGFALYWLWELVLKLFSLLGKRTAKPAPAHPETATPVIPKVGTGHKVIVEAGSQSQYNPQFLDPTS